MPEAAHPQRTDADMPQLEDDVVVKNPFPSAMTVPGLDGDDVVVELVALEGVVYAPRLEDLPLAPHVRQYVTQYCAAWSASVLTAGKLEASWPAPPRRAQLVFRESQLRAMLGLAADESLITVVSDPVANVVRFVVESPRLPSKERWDCEPPYVPLPIAAYYEVDGQVPR